MAIDYGMLEGAVGSGFAPDPNFDPVYSRFAEATNLDAAEPLSPDGSSVDVAPSGGDVCSASTTSRES